MTFNPDNFPDQRTTMALWRTPTPNGGTATGATYTGVRLTGALCPPLNLSPAANETGQAVWIFVYAGTAVRAGDELRRGSEIYTVYKVERWTQAPAPPVSVAFAEK